MDTNLPTLDANETLLFLSTKNAHHVNYSEDKAIVFEEGREETILNDYPIVAFAFKEIVCIPSEHIQLKYINDRLFDIIEKIKPSLLRRILEEVQGYRFVGSTGYGVQEMSLSYSPAQAIFITAYGYIQAIQVYTGELGEFIPLINLDESLIKRVEN
jgi:hypothetical protein